MARIGSPGRPQVRGVSVLDVVLALSVLGASVWGVVHLASRSASSPALSGSTLRADVYTGDRELLQSVSLDQDREIELVGGRMQLEIRAGAIAVVQSDCPRGTCVHAGKIRHPGETITCVPNRILVELKAEGGGEDIDVVAR